MITTGCGLPEPPDSQRAPGAGQGARDGVRSTERRASSVFGAWVCAHRGAGSVLPHRRTRADVVKDGGGLQQPGILAEDRRRRAGPLRAPETVSPAAGQWSGEQRFSQGASPGRQAATGTCAAAGGRAPRGASRGSAPAGRRLPACPGRTARRCGIGRSGRRGCPRCARDVVPLHQRADGRQFHKAGVLGDLGPVHLGDSQVDPAHTRLWHPLSFHGPPPRPRGWSPVLRVLRGDDGVSMVRVDRGRGGIVMVSPAPPPVIIGDALREIREGDEDRPVPTGRAPTPCHCHPS